MNMVFHFQGCLKPVKVIIPKGSLLDPSEEAAVVGGNVLTSQRVVDVVLQAFGACAASQGCMNNVTLGTEEWGYYETVAGGSGAVRNSNFLLLLPKLIIFICHKICLPRDQHGMVEEEFTHT